MATEMTEEDKARELENKIRAPLVWAVDRRGVRVEDLQEKRFEEALDILREHYLSTEVTYRMLNFLDDEESVESFLGTSKNQMKDKISLVAIKEASNEIIGVLLQRIVDKSTFSRTFSRTKIVVGEKQQTIVRYYKAIEGEHNPHDLYETERYLKIYSMVLLPKYREKGLEKLLLKCAMRSGRSCKVTAIVGIFASGAVQHLAKEVGFQDISSIFYDKYIDEEVKGRIFYNPGFHNYGAMLMGRRIPDEGEEDV